MAVTLTPATRGHTRTVDRIWAAFEDTPLLFRTWLAGGIGLGLIGGLVGFTIGMAANPSTAWVAILEVGIPSGILGAVLGFVVGLLIMVVRRIGSR